MIIVLLCNQILYHEPYLMILSYLQYFSFLKKLHIGTKVYCQDIAREKAISIKKR